MTTKGVEMMSEDPRSCRRGWCFGELTNPRGGDNVKSTHFFADWYNARWWVDDFDMFPEVKKEIYRVPPEETATAWEGKPADVQMVRRPVFGAECSGSMLLSRPASLWPWDPPISPKFTPLAPAWIPARKRL